MSFRTKGPSEFDLCIKGFERLLPIVFLLTPKSDTNGRSTPIPKKSLLFYYELWVKRRIVEAIEKAG